MYVECTTMYVESCEAVKLPSYCEAKPHDSKEVFNFELEMPISPCKAVGSSRVLKGQHLGMWSCVLASSPLVPLVPALHFFTEAVWQSISFSFKVNKDELI